MPTDTRLWHAHT